MRRLLIAVLTLLAVSSVLAVASTATARDDRNDNRGRNDGRTVLEFDTMTPVVPPFTGTANPIRGVNGGGVAWAIKEGEGELRADGRLEIKIRGLVVAASGVNPAPTFAGAVSCLTPANGGTTVATVNVFTDPFPATRDGNARIEDTVNLPHPCIAPIIFVVRGDTHVWFAVTGN